MKIPVFAVCMIGSLLLSRLGWSQGQLQFRTPGNDSLKVVQILNTENFRSEQRDSVSFTFLIGNVRLKQENTIINCDSMVSNSKDNIIESFGHVHINDNDSTNIYSDYMKYQVDKKTVYFQKNVKLTDGKGILTSDELQYDLNQKVGVYNHGGKIVNNGSVLTSEQGTYYEATKDVYFRKNVVLRDPQYDLSADSLLYNTQTQISTFITETFILFKDSTRRTVRTREGYYDLKNRKAEFGKRPVITDGSQQITGDAVKIDDSTGISTATGNAVYKDTAQGVTMIANYMLNDKKKNTFLATQKPLMILKQEKDSIYVTADTLFSARLIDAPWTKKAMLRDSLHRLYLDSLHRAQSDSLHRAQSDSLHKADTLAGSLSHASPPTTLSPRGRSREQEIDTASAPLTAADSNLRYIQGYHHVRIFSDSLQAISDSLYYSSKDSIFRLFINPIAWGSGNYQVTGDTMFVYTKNKKASRLYVFENALTINKVGANFYNQIKGTTINVYFKDGEVDYMRAKGNAESIYYVQDDNKAYTGVNKAHADIIDMIFTKKEDDKGKELNRVILRNEAEGSMIPFKKVSFDDMRLRGFKWLEDKRPKTKYELFE